MSNIYHEGCPLYRTSTEHICILSSFPIAMRIIPRLLAKTSRSIVMVTCIFILIQPITAVSGARYHQLGEPSNQHGGCMATHQMWSWNGLYTTASIARKLYVTCIRKKFELGASV